MNKNVLDASALLALLHGEPGCDMVAEHLPYSIISAVNVAEVMTILINHHMPPEKAEEAITSILNEVIPFDLHQAKIAAVLRKETKAQGLSLGDRACLGLAKYKKLPVLTADHVWHKLKIGIEVRLIR